MGIDAVMWFRLEREMADDELAAVSVEARRAFPSTLGSPDVSPIERDEWYEWPPNEKILTSDLYFERLIEKPQGGHWYRVYVPDRYCFVESPRFWPNGPDARGAEGAMEHCDLADWIERKISSAEVWYGNDQEENLRRFDAYARRIRRAYLHVSNSVPEGYHEALPIVNLARTSAGTHPERARWLLEFHADRLSGPLQDALRRLAAEICPR